MNGFSETLLVLLVVVMVFHDWGESKTSDICVACLSAILLVVSGLMYAKQMNWL